MIDGGNLVLSVNNLSASYFRGGVWNEALNSITLNVTKGEILGIVGESGSGKSTLGLLCIGYRASGARVDAGEINFIDVDLLRAPASAVRSIRGRRISFVPQNPTTALDPSIKVGALIREVIRRHLALTHSATEQKVETMLGRVGLESAATKDRYPHQLSGGQQQRVAIAMALACDPDLVILDEPTTGLDVTTQQQIVALLADLRKMTATSMLYITHDLALLSQIADRILVMRNGKVVEVDTTADIICRPTQPYTRNLLAAIPDISSEKRAFEKEGAEQEGDDFALRLQNVSIDYSMPSILPAARRASRPAVSPLSLDILSGKVFGIVGESGSGKSSLAKAICGAVKRTSGDIWFESASLDPRGRRRTADQRRKIQYIYQNPDASLNPRARISTNLERPLRYYFNLSSQETKRRIDRALEQVHLPLDYAKRFPSELSGGERQRVAIARAILAEPTVLICDEILSALDVSTQFSILETLNELRRREALTSIFISHDLAVVKRIAENVVVLFSGQLMQVGDSFSIYGPPYHPYTWALLCAVPHFGKPVTRAQQVEALPRGGGDTCAFFSRCPKRLQGICDNVPAPWRQSGRNNVIRCHRTLVELVDMNRVDERD
jgi:peptide/nickel transport system ATP-binding protein